MNAEVVQALKQEMGIEMEKLTHGFEYLKKLARLLIESQEFVCDPQTMEKALLRLYEVDDAIESAEGSIARSLDALREKPILAEEGE